MSFTAFTNTLRTVIPTLSGFTTKTELPNAYRLEDCGRFRVDGWGLTFGSADEDMKLQDGSIGNRHAFYVVLCREVVTVRGDAGAQITAVQAMKADALTLQRSLLATNVLGQTDIDIITYVNTSAVRYGNVDANNWVTMSVQFNVTIREQLF